MTTITSTDEYAAYTDDTVKVNDLTRVKSLAVEMKTAEAAVARAEDALKKAKARLATIQEDLLPKLMQELELPNFTIEDRETGARIVVSLDEEIRVSIPSGGKSRGVRGPDNRPAAYDFFRSIGLGGIIKKEIAVNVGLRGDNFVKHVVGLIQQENPDLDVGVTEKIEPATVTAEIKRLLRAGKSVPLDVFNVTQLTKAKAEVS